MIGSPDDPSDAPTGLYDYGAAGSLPPKVDNEPNDAADSASGEPDSAPDPWYKNRLLLGLWATAVVLLIVLIVYGVVEISRGAGGGSTSTTTSTTSTGSSTKKAEVCVRAVSCNRPRRVSATMRRNVGVRRSRRIRVWG